MAEEARERLGAANREKDLPSHPTRGPNPPRLVLKPKRTKLERYLDILRVLNDCGPLRRTHILYRANLSWSDLDGTLQKLEESGTLRRVELGRRVYYEITERGVAVLADLGQSLQTLEERSAATNAP